MHQHELEDSVTQLIATLERSSFARESNNKQQQIAEFISPIQLYRTGLVLYESPRDEHLMQSYQQFIARIPQSYLSQVLLHELNEAYCSMVSALVSSHDKTTSIAAVITASQALAGVYCGAPRVCQAAGTRTSVVAFIQALGVAYDCAVRRTSRTSRAEIVILQLLSAILTDGLLFTSSDTTPPTADGGIVADDEERRLQTIMEAIQVLTADEKSTCLADLQEMQARSTPTTTLRSRIRAAISATPQRDYLLHMIATSSKNTPAPPTLKTAPKSALPPTGKPTAVDPRDEIRRRIRQVQIVLPHLGDGYVEAALSAFQGEVERTVAALLDGSQLPPTLQRLDPTLPARAAETTPDGYVNDDEEARLIAKLRVRRMEQDQEAEAYALNVLRVSEYDDDYDDQYDDFDGGVAVGDGGGLDVDIDTVKMYNRVARESEKEVAFWNESRNTNRVQKLVQAKKEADINDDNGDDEEEARDGKQFRGHDKIKGGRPIGPDGKVLPRPKGGKQAAAASHGSNPTPANTKPTNSQGGTKTPSGTPGAAAQSPHGETELSKLQKRRKMLNKAKTGNHHRKDAAQRKTGGMG